jgi:hypothetical protein
LTLNPVIQVFAPALIMLRVAMGQCRPEWSANLTDMKFVIGPNASAATATAVSFGTYVNNTQSRLQPVQSDTRLDIESEGRDSEEAQERKVGVREGGD